MTEYIKLIDFDNQANIADENQDKPIQEAHDGNVEYEDINNKGEI